MKSLPMFSLSPKPEAADFFGRGLEHFPKETKTNWYEQDREAEDRLRWHSPCSAACGTLYKAEAEVWVDHCPQTTWNFLVNPSNFACLMSHLNKGELLSPGVALWELADHFDKVCWKTTVTQNQPPYLLVLESVEGAVGFRGYVQVFPESEGSRVKVHLEHLSPGGPEGEVLARLCKDPQRQLEQDLQKLGQLIVSKHGHLPEQSQHQESVHREEIPLEQ